MYNDYRDCIFAIETSNKYPTIKAAIINGGYTVWNHEKMKRAFNFGNGTLKDFERYCKDNFIKVIGPERFFAIVDKLKDKETHYNFVKESMLNYR